MTAESIAKAVGELRRSRAYAEAERQLGFAAVCVVGTAGRQRRRWDDNEGAHPTRLVVTTDAPHKAGVLYNRGVHSADGVYHTHAHVWLRTREHAERLVAWVYDEIRAEPMMHGWTNLEPWHFELLLGMGAERMKFEVFDDEQKQRRVLAKLRKLK